MKHDTVELGYVGKWLGRCGNVLNFKIEIVTFVMYSDTEIST